MLETRRRLAGVLLAGLVGLLCGCASAPPPVMIPGEGMVSGAEVMATPSPINVYDPIEPLNRAIYQFNAVFDDYVFLPVVDAYEFVTPDFVEERVSDFFSNLLEIPTFANSLLQLKGERAGRAVTRFVVNTMFTLGFYDLAGARGIEPMPEDFGQTLGYWGVGNGPFLMIPVLGPSNLRDGTGILVDLASYYFIFPNEVTDTLAYKAGVYVLYPIDRRRNIPFRYYQTGSPFEYELVRLLYTQRRKFEIAN
jgi:phospholipid-binding lipoprotein MlaA